MKNKVLVISLIIVFITAIGLGVIEAVKYNKTTVTETDAVKFSKEYTKVSEDNVFQYKTSTEIINILENGTGIVYLGFPECKWCQQYAVYLNEVARQNGINTIYYFNIKEDRSNNTSDYQKIVSLLNDNLAYDDEGNKRVYVPDVTFVVKGNIIGHDNESSYDVTGEPTDYWTEEKVTMLETKLRTLMLEVKQEHCSSCEE